MNASEAFVIFVNEVASSFALTCLRQLRSLAKTIEPPSMIELDDSRMAETTLEMPSLENRSFASSRASFRMRSIENFGDCALFGVSTSPTFSLAFSSSNALTEEVNIDIKTSRIISQRLKCKRDIILVTASSVRM